MKNELTCKVVEDLLPSYVEELTNDVTNEAVRTHMEQCENCREKLNSIKATDWQEEQSEEKEIDYLKKTRNGYRKKVMVGVILTAVLFFAVLFIRMSIVPVSVDFSMLDLKIKVDENEKFVYFCGNLKDTTKGIAKLSYKMEDGVLNISLRQTMTPVFYKNTKVEHYYYKGELEQIRVLDRIVWDHGKSILPDVAEIYATKHLYIGCMPDDGASLHALKFWERFGNSTSELQTSKEPYGMTLFLEEEFSKENAERIEKWMKSYASAMIALTDNMSYMKFVYLLDGKKETFTFTEQQADKLAGQSVKKIAKNAADFQTLMGNLDLVQEVALYEQ